MIKSLIVSSQQDGLEIALLENKRLVELNKETHNQEFSVGDIYLGTVKKLKPGLNAAFVDIGYEKDAFLHYLDLGHQFSSLSTFIGLIKEGKKIQTNLSNFRRNEDIPKDGKIDTLLQKGQQIMVQVVKEPISTKGPRLSSEISFAGRFLVLVPFSDVVSVSKKIKSSEERRRLKDAIMKLKSKNFGFIIRTAAEGATYEELDKDVRDLVEKWTNAAEKLKSGNAPLCLVQEISRATGILRDSLNDTFSNIYVDNEKVYKEIYNYIQSIQPEQVDIVKLHKGKEPLFEAFDIDKQIKYSFGKNVTFTGGAYLVIEHTEALHVIDVNSGTRTNADNDQETNATNTNLEAAVEIARQLRLRDMGGIIVVDFIDMKKAANRKLVHDKLMECMASDKAKHTVLPMSKFGLIQITRQRVRSEIRVETVETCPTCQGTGKVAPSLLLSDEIESNLRFILKDHNQKKISLHAHPFVAAFLTKGLKSMRMNWFFKYQKWIPVKSEKTYHMGEYHFFNGNEEPISLT